VSTDAITEELARVLRRIEPYCDLLPAKAAAELRAALAIYAARDSIIQTPQSAAREALRAAADRAGERHD